MADSVKVVDNRTFKRYHARASSGHIHKGHSIVAANASIPTKFQTIVTDNSDKKGFLARAKRFKEDAFITEAPPPGCYGDIPKVDKISPSYSKKGTGSFASKSKRQGRYFSSAGPGPGSYALPSLLSTRKDFNKCQVERLFQMPIAEAREKINEVPAPNSYEVLKYKSGKANNVTANAAFKSTSKRELMNLSEQKRNPAPGHYEINDDPLHQSTKVPFSSFKSTSKRQMQPDADAIPGPGAYDPNAPVEQPAKLIFPRKHYLCISAPAMPLPMTPPAPGPGAYEVRNFEDAPKHYMSSSAFVSTTGRWAVQPTSGEMPGPAHYRPVNVGKQSFIFNSSRRWI
ncbi:O(6)-methylguanine-induced apoptosis 2 isoform X2 [Aplysia californica]|uniref:O(6)-methylguanine-induced apoptosis 2 isoform X2 n=1 Tax=Aplysia californica TaxID=6500 RepID=A0ABM0JU34_APLCA|nr:O(6)-methylguanine-induced apoptosis 2 isoform X2 [Aplysia californica]